MKTLKILVVDDQAIIADDLIMKVVQMGYSGSSVCSGKEAIEKISLNFDPDLILMDVTLKDGEDGIQTARVIQQKFKKIPIIFVTARTHASILKESEDLVHTGYIEKPFSKQQLQLTIHQLLATA